MLKKAKKPRWGIIVAGSTTRKSGVGLKSAGGAEAERMIAADFGFKGGPDPGERTLNPELVGRRPRWRVR